MGVNLLNIRFNGVLPIHSHHRHLVNLVYLQALQQDEVLVQLWLGCSGYASSIQPKTEFGFEVVTLL